MIKEINSSSKLVKNEEIYKITLEKALWIFIIFSVIGYYIETLWCFIDNGYFESRKGLIYGDFSQVYGIGALILIFCLSKIVDKNKYKIFFTSALLGGFSEFICSFIQEKIFNSVSWEYTDSFFSIGGRTNLKYCFYWGVLGVLLIKVVYPQVDKFISYLIVKCKCWIKYLIFGLIFLNVFLTIAALQRQQERQANEPAYNYLDIYLDNNFSDEVLSDIYPNMTFK